MRELESYSIEELEELTGYDRRTVSYYISEGLLPKVGRRGRHTRYGREFVDRLKFIQRAKDLQDSGKLPSVTLADMARLIDTLEPADIAEAGKSNRKLQELFARGLEGGVGEQQYTRLGEPASQECPPAAAEPMASYSRDVLKGRSRKLNRAAMSAVRMTKQLDIDDKREATHSEMHDFQRQLMKETQATQYELRDLIEGVRQMREELSDELRQLRDLREELTEVRRGAPTRTFWQSLQARARKWSRSRGLPSGMSRVARLRADGNSWEFPLDRKMIMLDGDLSVLCEGRPGTRDGEFIVLRVPFDVLRAGAERYFKSQASGTVMCLVTPAGVDVSTRMHRGPQIVMDEFLIDKDHLLQADKGE